jgi:hypothetical protein
VVDVPAAPPMGRVSNVELMHTGTWDLSTGRATFTVEDLANAVAALDCPAVRRPILKFGHTPDPAQGQPAIGFIANMATAEQGRTLIGDYVGMPGWLVDTDDDGVSVLKAAYPDRSIEGEFDHRCQLNHTHPFVITAVALLGDEHPAIGTIQSLQDLGALYGVAASTSARGERVSVRVHSSEGSAMPNPRPTTVAATVTSEDVRRAFYAAPIGAGWSKWIEEIQLDPLQLIVMDDDTSTRSRVAVSIGEGEGQDAVAFADPVPVIVRYDDAPQVAASLDGGSISIVFASRAESRPESTADKMARVAAAGKKTTPTVPAGVSASTKGAGMDPVKLREGLGLDPGASDEDVRAALVAEGLATPAAEGGQTGDGTPPPAVPAQQQAAAPRMAGTMVVDASAWDEREKRIKNLEAAAQRRAREERDQIIDDAVKAGKFAPSRKDHWKRLWDADPDGAREVIAGLAKNVIPVEALGSDVEGAADLDEEFAHLFPPAATPRKKG